MTRKENTVWGYARISTPTQSIERQVRNIKKEYPSAVIVEEVYTGTKQDRPEWKNLLKNIKPSDTIVFDSVSRMSRNAKEGFVEYKELYDKGVTLVFLKEPHINTDTYKKALDNHVSLTGDKVDYILEGVNKYLMALAEEQISLAFRQAQKEIDDLHQRTKEGIETARLKGKQIGMKKGSVLNIKKEKPIKDIIEKKSKDFGGTLNDNELRAVLAITKIKIPCGKEDDDQYKEVYATVSRNTFYKYKREIREKIKEIINHDCL